MTRIAAVAAVLATACAGGVGHCRPAAAPEEEAMRQSKSPSGEVHPGEIVNDDRIENRTWTANAADVPQTVAWVKVGDRWEPVLRIEVTGTPDQRRITKYGRDGKMLESTIQTPPPPPRAPAPPVPAPPVPKR